MSDLKSYEPYTTDDPDPDDTVFDEWVLTKVKPGSESGWFVTGDQSWGCFVPSRDGVPSPEVGDTFRTYGGIGRPIQGQVLNGQTIWYRTAVQRVVHRAQEIARYDAEKRERFARERDELDSRYEALPAPFKARVDRFRAASPDFRVDSEGYETFILQQAALLAEHFKTEDAVLAWERIGSKDGEPPYDMDGQMAAAPDGWSDGHSGNTHGCAIRFAVALLRGESV